jgi:hypothetical protein
MEGPLVEQGPRWVHLVPEGTRFFQTGEELEAGTLLGVSAFGGRVEVAERRCRVTQVIFDMWEDRLTLVLEPTLGFGGYETRTGL